MKIPATAPRYLPRWLRHSIVKLLQWPFDLCYALNPDWRITRLTGHLFTMAFFTLWDHRQIRQVKP